MPNVDQLDKLAGEPAKNNFYKIYLKNAECKTQLGNNANDDQFPIDGFSIIAKNVTNKNKEGHAQSTTAKIRQHSIHAVQFSIRGDNIQTILIGY